MKAYLFSYGTLQEDHIQMMLFGDILKTEVDSIEGYVTLNDYFGYPRIVEFERGIVYGKVLEIDEVDFPIVDRYESEAYEKKVVETSKGRQAYVYFPTHKLN
tara:strand:+ start:780 stop:1085 length:306 start_codon:yes stop_codon:yes gene_type:complete